VFHSGLKAVFNQANLWLDLDLSS